MWGRYVWAKIWAGGWTVLGVKRSEKVQKKIKRELWELGRADLVKTYLWFIKLSILWYENGSVVPAGVSVAMMMIKRYFLVEKGRMNIWLLVGHSQLWKDLRKTVKIPERKYTPTFSGKTECSWTCKFLRNLLSFWTLLCKEFLQPIITPYELELACNKEQEFVY